MAARADWTQCSSIAHNCAYRGQRLRGTAMRMSDLIDKTVGIYHFLADRLPANVPTVDPKPRKVNPWRHQGRVIVARVSAADDVRPAIEKTVGLLGRLEQAIGRGDRVLVKPNYNSPDPPPASTDPSFLRAVLEMLVEAGARPTIGESAGGVWRPTRNVFRQVHVDDLARELGVGLIAFDDADTEWVRIRIGGDYLRELVVPRAAYEADKLVYLPCMKTHRLAGFSGALKLGFGFVAPGQRRGFHAGHLQQKVAEVNLCWQPDLIIMDGRKAFVSGGPNKGQVVEPGLLLASGDLIAVDVEAAKTLLAGGGKNRLPSDPWQSPQVVTAVKHGLGAGRDGYVVVD